MEYSSASRWPGEYMDGQSAALRLVTGHLGAELSLREDGRELARWPLHVLRAEVLPGGALVRIQNLEIPGALFTTRETGIEEALRDAQVPIFADVRRDSAGVKRGLFFGAAFVALVALGYWNLPAISRAIAFQVPVEIEAKLGGQVEALFGDAYCDDPEGTSALHALRDRLAPTSRGDVRVLNLSMPNAFALPGGKIVLTRGLLEEARGPDEVAGVLAHEIQHSELRHVLAQVVRSSLSTAAWAVTLGDYSGLFVVDPGTAFALSNLRFSRADEAEADRGAVAMLGRANISRRGFRDFFQRLASKTDRVPEWLSSHPLSAARAEAAGDDAEAQTTTEALPVVQWEQLRDICRGAPPPADGLSRLFSDE